MLKQVDADLHSVYATASLDAAYAAWEWNQAQPFPGLRAINPIGN